MIWTKAKIIRPTLTICLGINSMYTQRSVEAHILGFVCFQVPMAFRKACLFRDKPRLLCHSSSLSLIHKPDGSSSSTFSIGLFSCYMFRLLRLRLLVPFSSLPSRVGILFSPSSSFIFVSALPLTAHPDTHALVSGTDAQGLDMEAI